MTKDDILRMAREAGISNAFMPPQFSEVFERFAALVAAAERDECAKECIRQIGLSVPSYDTAIQCADAIRARGTK